MQTCELFIYIYIYITVQHHGWFNKAGNKSPCMNNECNALTSTYRKEYHMISVTGSDIT